MSDFVREVDEEVRHEQFRTFLTRYWGVLLGLVIIILAGVGAWRAYLYYDNQKAETAGGQYLNALDLDRDGKPAEAAPVLQGLIKDGPAGYKMLARFRLAADTGEHDAVAGAKLFDEIGQDGSIEPALQNLARLRGASLLLDSLSYPDIKAKLDPLADQNSLYRGSARELLALAALKAGQYEDAGKALDLIQNDPTTSATLRQRAMALSDLVRSGPEKAAADPTPTPAASAPQPEPAAPSASPTDAPAKQ